MSNSIPKTIIKKKLDSALIKYVSSFQIFQTDVNFWKQIYMMMWDEFPHVIALSTDGCYLNTDIDDYFSNADEDTEYNDDKKPHFCTFESISVQSTLCNIIDHYKNAVIYRDEDYPIIIGDHFIIYVTIGDNSDMYVIQNKEYLSTEFIDLVVEKYNNTVDYTYLWGDNGSIEEVSLKIKESDISKIDLKTNYNDDLPHKEITDFLKSNESGMVLLHGVAGSGKSAYIKYLINEITGRHFIIIDASDINYFSNSMLAQIFLNSKDTVIVIEDNATDKSGINKIEQLKSLLSIDGGILGGNVSYKFICTFNDDAYNYKNKIQSSKIKVDYEFQNLTSEKTKALCEEYGIDYKEGQSLPLSKIIKGEDADDYDKNINKHKIGFSK